MAIVCLLGGRPQHGWDGIVVLSPWRIRARHRVSLARAGRASLARDARVRIAGRRGRARPCDDVLRRGRHGARRLRRRRGALAARRRPDGRTVPDAPLVRAPGRRPRPGVPVRVARAGRADGGGVVGADRRLGRVPGCARPPPAPPHADPRGRRSGHAERAGRDPSARDRAQDAGCDRARGAGRRPGSARPLVGRAHGRGGARRGRDDRDLAAPAQRGHPAARARPGTRAPRAGRRGFRALRRAARRRRGAAGALGRVARSRPPGLGRGEQDSREHPLLRGRGRGRVHRRRRGGCRRRS